MSDIDHFENYIDNWINTLNEPAQYGPYFGPLCPYAKSVWKENKVKIVKIKNWDLNKFWSTISLECENFSNDYDVVIIGAETNEEIVHHIQLAGGIDALNSSLNVQNKDLWLVSQFGGTYTIVIIQRITGLDSQSKVLEKKRYYENRYNDYVFNKNIIRRRKMREHLNSDK